MNRVLLFILAVIILVSISWFRSSRAQDVSSLTEEQKAALMQQLGSGQSSLPIPRTPRDRGLYLGQPIFDSVPPTGRPEIQAQGPGTPAPPQAGGTSAPAQSSPMKLFTQLEPFGRDLFSGPREATPPNDVAAARDYILGPGDDIIIYLWGRAEQEYRLTVDREGKVFIPRIGTIVAWGKSVEDFESYAKQQFSKAFSDFSLSVSLGVSDRFAST